MKLSLRVLLLQCFLIGLINATEYNCHCPGKCGNITIPYPFGIKEGCYLDNSYHIKCDQSTQTPRLNLSFSLDLSKRSATSVEVLEVKLDGCLRVKLPIAYACYNKSGLVHSPKTYHMNRFPFSSTHNKFVGLGCDIAAFIKFTQPTVTINCQSKCGQLIGFNNGSSIGLDFCKTTIPPNMTYAHILVRPRNNHTKTWKYNKCGYGFIVEKNQFNFSEAELTTMTQNQSYPVTLAWFVGNTTCEDAQKNNITYMCQENSVCINGDANFPGYRCKCSHGYRGNAYIPNGCQDVNECESPELNDCLPESCKNKYGSYTCVCPKGQQGNPKRGGKCIPVVKRSVIKGISEGVAGAAFAMIFVYLGAKKRKRIKGRKDFFKQNGGIMLQKMLFTCKDPINKAKIFTEEELKKATDSFNDANVIGAGGYGTVYKGILANKTLVAIKKSKVIDQSQIKQFVNEVIILSQINHRNVVRLLGCCLETQVPLLVYEYITNNTLCHHIHNHPMLNLGKRLKIAEDIAEALAYMHSTTQIIHRDVKPSNILLNDDFTAKVSDFGISTLVPLGQTHLSTFVKGTIGYVDPEYFRTSKLTEKSDVYSFGVVLVELLTGTNIHSLEISLRVYRGAAEYLVSILEHNALVQVLDDQLKRDEYTKIVEGFAKIAINCLDLEGKRRPTMDEVKQELKQLRCLLLSIEAESI